LRDLLVRTAGRCDSLYARLAAIGSSTGRRSARGLSRVMLQKKMKDFGLR